MTTDSGSRKVLIGILFCLLAVIIFGLVWFFLGSSASPVGFGWYLFSFAAGLSMIVLPCTLPLAFIIVPLSMGKGPAKGFAIALAFGLGVAFTLSMYGVIAAVIGKVAIGSLGAPLEIVKNWLYFIAGAFAYLFALGGLGLIKFRMPSYSGAFPSFIQKQQDILKALLLGLFLGNIGVGCPHPATPVILTRIAVSGDVFYGWLLFFIHAVGRILPLLFLAALGILGVNALAALVKHKEQISRATGWGMVFVAGFILVLGLFSHDWWVLSGQHTFLESITQEERLLGAISDRLNLPAPHEHGLPPADHTGLLGLPLSLGTWTLLFLWILPFFWYYSKRKKIVYSMSDSPEKQIEQKTLPYLWWNFFGISAVLVLVFGYILPHRFLEKVAAEGETHATDDGHTMTEEHMMGHMNEMMAGDGHEHGALSNYHEAADITEGPAVLLWASADSPLLTAGKRSMLEFFVYDAVTGEPITNLEIEHEKYVHAIGVRDDLNAFFHIHPSPSFRNDAQPGTWAIEHTFEKPGTYKIWTDIKVNGVVHTIGQPLLTVEGEGATSEKNLLFETEKSVGGHRVRIHYETIAAGAETALDFTITGKDGTPVAVEPYLGADMHLVAIKDDLSAYVHTHPAEHGESADHMHSVLPIPVAFAHGGAAEEFPITFSAAFPSPGIYKLFGQFRPQGSNLPEDAALTADFYVEVNAAQAAPSTAAPGISLWWYKLIWSVVLIAILGVAVKKFITVPK